MRRIKQVVICSEMGSLWQPHPTHDQLTPQGGFEIDSNISADTTRAPSASMEDSCPRVILSLSHPVLESSSNSTFPVAWITEPTTPKYISIKSKKNNLYVLYGKLASMNTVKEFHDTFSLCGKTQSFLELTLPRPNGGHYSPHYHESVSRCCKVRALLTRLPDFVPFDVCQFKEHQFWCLFFKKLKKILGCPWALGERQH